MQGKTLAHYRIIDQLGSGGMGVVYRALDTTLDREVAIKVLPDLLHRDPEHLARFEKEARILASLNHPGIATVYGLHEQDGRRFMAMELVPGKNLRELIKGRRRPVSEALDIGYQIGRALETAHGAGIIHRDLKPHNVMVTPTGKVKVLDFGLARSLPPVDSTENAPTLSSELTIPGALLGTPDYMSPEQSRGEPADARADIWAFGAVLYEMLSGVKVFGGKSVPETLFKVGEIEPDYSLLPAEVPDGIRRLVRRCLAKDTDKRLQAIGDARLILQEEMESPEESIPMPEPRSSRALRMVPWLLVPLVAVAVWMSKPSPTPAPVHDTRFEVAAPEGLRFVNNYRTGLALSPDGKTLAFVAGTNDSYSVRGSTASLYLRHLDQWESRPIPGTEGARNPVFSPDGRWLAFEQDHRLKKVPVAGGGVMALTDVVHAHFGLDWGRNGDIAFALAGEAGIGVVDAAGGVPDTLLAPDPETPEKYLRLPHFLPDGRGLLFTSMDMGTSMDHERNVRTKVLDLASGSVKTLIGGGSDARYVESGHLVFAREGNLYAVGFDREELEVVGGEFLVVEGVCHSVHAGSGTRETAAAQVTIADDGTLAYMAGSAFPERIRSVCWIDREGNEEPIDLDPKQYLGVFLSEDESELLLSTNYVPYQVWSYDLSRKILRRETFEGINHLAVYGPGPDHFTVTANLDGEIKIFTKELHSGPGTARYLEGTVGHWVGPWDREGRVLLTDHWGTGIWAFGPEGQGREVLATSSGEKNASLSPDGRWMAFTANESDQLNVYVKSLSGEGAAVQVSVDGGRSPGWARDGSEIFFWANDFETMMAARVTEASDRIRVATPEALFRTEPLIMGGRRNYGIASDGRFVIVKTPTDSLQAAIRDQVFPDRIRVVTGWTKELEDR